MELLSHAQFSRDMQATQYLLEVTVLFFDSNGNCVNDKMETDWISIKAPPGVYEMECEKPKNVKYFLVIIGVKGGRDEKEIVSFGARGIGLLGGGGFDFCCVLFCCVLFGIAPKSTKKV